MMIIDGKNMVLGRLSSLVAKKLLNKEKVEIINAEKIIILGDPKKIHGEYLELRQKGDVYKGPFFPKRPDDIFKRTVKGMLPKNRTGRSLLKNLEIYIGTPEGKEKTEEIQQKPVNTTFITLGELSKRLGWLE